MRLGEPGDAPRRLLGVDLRRFASWAGLGALVLRPAHDRREDRDSPFPLEDLSAHRQPGLVAGDLGRLRLLEHDQHRVVEAVGVELRGAPQPAFPLVPVADGLNLPSEPVLEDLEPGRGCGRGRLALGWSHQLYSYSSSVSLTGQPTSGPMSEEQKAERRTVVANNRNWDSAEKVRRSWLADAFLTRTSPPKNAETFVALAVIHGERTEDYNSLYTTLTKAQSGYQATAALASRAEAGTPRQALMLALALLVCEWESRTSRDTWRRPGERDRRYLAALVQWGTSPPTSSSSC